jgi:hypothetical protein
VAAPALVVRRLRGTRHGAARRDEDARIDAAQALADRLAKDAGKDASGDLCVDLARIAQLRGEPATPSQFPGWNDARLRLKPAVAWLDLCAALLTNRPLDARALADRVADPSHREYVEAALLRWSSGDASAVAN